MFRYRNLIWFWFPSFHYWSDIKFQLTARLFSDLRSGKIPTSIAWLIWPPSFPPRTTMCADLLFIFLLNMLGEWCRLDVDINLKLNWWLWSWSLSIGETWIIIDSQSICGMFLLAWGRFCDQLYQMNIGNEISIWWSDFQSVSSNGP